MRELVITRGLPASGKTTWAKLWVSADEEPGARVRVNRDDLRQMLFGEAGVLTYAQEERVTQAQIGIVEAVLKGRGGASVIVDDTNLRLKHARAWADLAQRLSVDFRVVDFIDVPLDELISRDAGRERSVGEQVIRDMYMRFLHKQVLPEVVASTATSAEPYEPNENLPMAWIVDMDGTLARMNGRSPYDLTRVSEDEPVEAVIDIVSALHFGGFAIVVASGREDTCREATEEWLDRYGVPWDDLVMRKAGDHRNDAIVKRELLFEEIAPSWNVRGTIDDRNRVVEMWRELGLTCAQVAPGDF